MKIKAAVILDAGKPIEIEELDLDGPRESEVLVRFTRRVVPLGSARDDRRHPCVVADRRRSRGSGSRRGGGARRISVKPGDHVVCSFIPNCGVCRWCATGQQAICDWGAAILEGCLPGSRFPRTGTTGDIRCTGLSVDNTRSEGSDTVTEEKVVTVVL